MIKRVGRAPPPAAIGGTGFQPVHRTGKMPVPPKTFQASHSWAFGPPLSMKRLVGRASAPARRSAQAGKPVPPEELFKAVLLWNAINGAPDILHGGPCPPYSP